MMKKPRHDANADSHLGNHPPADRRTPASGEHQVAPQGARPVSSLEALRAGYTPNKTRTPTADNMLTATLDSGMTRETPVNMPASMHSPTPRRVPTRLPTKEMADASIKNSFMICQLVAPMDSLIPDLPGALVNRNQHDGRDSKPGYNQGYSRNGRQHKRDDGQHIGQLPPLLGKIVGAHRALDPLAQAKTLFNLVGRPRQCRRHC